MDKGLSKDRSTVLGLIDQGGLSVRFQPIVDARAGEVCGYEALARPPAGFGMDVEGLFRTAIKTGVVSLLDMQCRETAMREAVARGLLEGNASLFINICPETLLDPAHRSGITDEFAEACGLSRDRIVLEITETTAVYNWELFKKTVETYRQRGYRIAIDDFGAGYGGLKMLHIIMPDFVKIDRHFISGLHRAPSKLVLTEAVATFCRKLGMEVLAEGVECRLEARAALRSGIDLMQGFHFGRPEEAPSPAKAFLEAVTGAIK